VAFGGYPPPRHFLSDLGMVAEVTSLSTATVRIPATPWVAGADGGVRAGVLAALVDVVAGSAALRSLHPDWMATADLTLQVVRPAVGPWVEARASVVRKGRTTLVVEVVVSNVDDSGRAVTGPGGIATPVAWSTLTFAVLPARDSAPMRDLSGEFPVRWEMADSQLDRPIDRELGIAVEDAAAGVVSLPVADYLRNSFGAVQGGVMAMLGEVATAARLEAGRPPDAGPVVVTGLQVAYLALGRVGPIVSRTRLLGSDPGSQGGGADGPGGGTAVVELLDRGVDDRLTTVISVRAVPAGPVEGVPVW